MIPASRRRSESSRAYRPVLFFHSEIATPPGNRAPPGPSRMLLKNKEIKNDSRRKSIGREIMSQSEKERLWKNNAF
jgi:hypothetical protein